MLVAQAWRHPTSAECATRRMHHNRFHDSRHMSDLNFPFHFHFLCSCIRSPFICFQSRVTADYGLLFPSHQGELAMKAGGKARSTAWDSLVSSETALLRLLRQPRTNMRWKSLRSLSSLAVVQIQAIHFLSAIRSSLPTAIISQRIFSTQLAPSAEANRILCDATHTRAQRYCLSTSALRAKPALHLHPVPARHGSPPRKRLLACLDMLL